ncbi:MAG: DUF1573 domain-containing protein [Planctomycetota bacterium]|jgi:hypothetical protein
MSKRKRVSFARVRSSGRATALATLALLLAGCGGGGGGSEEATPPDGGQPPTTTQTSGVPDSPTPVVTNVSAETSGAPIIRFAKMTHDFGAIVDTERVEATFPFTNEGTSTLVIEEVKASCGCTVPSLKKRRFEPGEGDKIKALFDPRGRSGAQGKTITVISNASEKPLTLSLRSDVQPMVVIHPETSAKPTRMLDFGTMPMHEQQRRQIKLLYRDPEMEFKDVTTNNKKLTARLIESGEVETVEDGQSTYRAVIDVTLADDAPWGLLYANRVSVNVRGRPGLEGEPIDQLYTVHVSGRVFGDLTASPPMLSLGSITGDRRFEKATVLKSASGQHFEILETRVVNSPLEGLEIEIVPRDDQSSYRLVLSGDSTGYRGAIRGQVSVKTDLMEKPIKIRFNGFVRD